MPNFKTIHEVLVNIAHDFPKLNYYQGMNYIVVFLWHTLRGTHPNLDPLAKHINDLRSAKSTNSDISENTDTMSDKSSFPEFS